MPRIPASSILDAKQVKQLQDALRKVAQAKDLCDRAGKCGLNVDSLMQDLDGMQAVLDGIHQHFVHGGPQKG